MDTDATGRRRRLGVLMLIGAGLMLVAGETFLKRRLTDMGFLFYWLLCFILTSGAIAVAYFDLRAVRQRGRKEARELLESTLTQIEKDARNKPPVSLAPRAKRLKD